MPPDEEITEQEPEKKVSRIILVFSISLGLVLLFSFLRYSVFQNYDMNLEMECDPTQELCFTRDCETDDCPPNGYSNYSQYLIKAHQFKKCELTDLCRHFCENPRNCEKIECDSEAGDQCSGPTLEAQ